MARRSLRIALGVLAPVAALVGAAAPTVAAGRDLYRYGFHRFGGQQPADAFELALHGAKPPVPEPEPPQAPTEPTPPPPSEAEAALS